MARPDEGAFLAGELGADGLPTEAARDEAELDRAKALEAMQRGRAWLGREFLTWLLVKSNEGAPICTYDGEDASVIFVGSVVLQGVAGEATELSAKGYQAAYAAVVRGALARGLLIQQARLRLMHDEKVYEVTLDAEHLSMRSVTIPKVLTEETDDQLLERLFLVDRAAGLVDALWAAFVEVRAEPEWLDREVPAMRAWITEP